MKNNSLLKTLAILVLSTFTVNPLFATQPPQALPATPQAPAVTPSPDPSTPAVAPLPPQTTNGLGTATELIRVMPERVIPNTEYGIIITGGSGIHITGDPSHRLSVNQSGFAVGNSGQDSYGIIINNAPVSAEAGNIIIAPPLRIPASSRNSDSALTQWENVFVDGRIAGRRRIISDSNGQFISSQEFNLNGQAVGPLVTNPYQSPQVGPSPDPSTPPVHPLITPAVEVDLAKLTLTIAQRNVADAQSQANIASDLAGLERLHFILPPLDPNPSPAPIPLPARRITQEDVNAAAERAKDAQRNLQVSIQRLKEAKLRLQIALKRASSIPSTSPSPDPSASPNR